MTCIVGLIDGKAIYIGADSLTVGSLDCSVVKNKKVFIKDEFIMGFTTSWRMGQILQYCFSPPKNNFKNIMEYMVTDFINELRKCFKENGYSEINNNVESGGNFLVGYKNRLFQIHSDFQVAESSHNFNSCGCGYSYALGSLYSTKTFLPEQRISLALKAAQEFSAGVREPFTILKL